MSIKITFTTPSIQTNKKYAALLTLLILFCLITGTLISYKTYNYTSNYTNMADKNNKLKAAIIRSGKDNTSSLEEINSLHTTINSTIPAEIKNHLLLSDLLYQLENILPKNTRLIHFKFHRKDNSITANIQGSDAVSSIEKNIKASRWFQGLEILKQYTKKNHEGTLHQIRISIVK